MSATPSTVALSSTKPAPAKPRRRWFQFSLRSLTIFMVVCSVLLGALGWRLQRARKQAETVKALRGLGCNVAYDYHYEPTEDGGFTSAQKSVSNVPAVLIQWLGEDFFHHPHSLAIRVQPKSSQDVQQFWERVGNLKGPRMLQLEGEWLDHDGLAKLRGHPTLQHVMLSSKHVTDADLILAGTMPELRELWLTGFGMNVTDKGVAGLDELRELRSFYLYHAPITDKAARHLANHPKLMALQLPGSHFTDESTLWLGKLTELRQLSIHGTEIGDAGLRNLKALTKLSVLSIGHSKITDEGLIHLQNLHELQFLSVPATKVHGPGLGHLTKLPKLVGVECNGNPVTDADLKYFEALPMLENLQLADSQVTDAGIANLKFPGKVTQIQLPVTKITDRSLRVLATQKQLKTLWVSHTSVTPEGVAQFKVSLPSCNIIP